MCVSSGLTHVTVFSCWEGPKWLHSFMGQLILPGAGRAGFLVSISSRVDSLLQISTWGSISVMQIWKPNGLSKNSFKSHREFLPLHSIFKTSHRWPRIPAWGLTILSWEIPSTTVNPGCVCAVYVWYYLYVFVTLLKGQIKRRFCEIWVIGFKPKTQQIFYYSLQWVCYIVLFL